MSRANKHSRTIQDLLFVGAIGVLLILLRYYISRMPRTLSSVPPAEERAEEVINSTALWQDGPSTERVAAPEPHAGTSIQSTVDSANPAADEIAFDSNNKSALNIVDTVSELPGGEVTAPQGVTAPDPAIANAMQESLAEGEAEQIQESQAPIEKMEAYCVKCREKREMQNVHRIVTKNGRNAMEGICPVCGTRLFRFIAR